MPRRAFQAAGQWAETAARQPPFGLQVRLLAERAQALDGRARTALARSQNWAASVEPLSAVVEDWPLVMVSLMASK